RRASRGRTSVCRGRSRLSTTADAAIAALAAGGLVVFPTETVYGMGVDALSDAAVARLVAVRGREEGKAILVLVSDLGMVERVAVGARGVVYRGGGVVAGGVSTVGAVGGEGVRVLRAGAVAEEALHVALEDRSWR